MPPSDVAAFWPYVQDLIDAGFAANNEITPALAADFADAKALLWIAWAREGKILAALITRLVRYRHGRVCIMTACAGGSFQRWKDFHREIEAYALAEHCVAVRIDGRAGWERALPDYQRVAVTLEKRL